jgi:hypothetical protein
MSLHHGDEDFQRSGLMNLAVAATALTELVRVVRVANTNEDNDRIPQTISDDEDQSAQSHGLSFTMPRTLRDSDVAMRSGDDPVTSVQTEACKEIFPQRLMQILSDPSISDIITWIPHGRSFWIIRPEVFTEKILPLYFPEARAVLSSKSKDKPPSSSSYKYPSFTRKLNRWGFRQVTKGQDTGAFHHKFFKRDEPELCLRMVCQKSRRPKQSETGSQTPDQTELLSNQKLRVQSRKEMMRSVTDSESVTSGSGASVEDSRKKRKLDPVETHGIEQISFSVPTFLSKPPPLSYMLPSGHGTFLIKDQVGTSTHGLKPVMSTDSEVVLKGLASADMGIGGSKMLLSVLNERSIAAQGGSLNSQQLLVNCSGILQPNPGFLFNPSPAILPPSSLTLRSEERSTKNDPRTEVHIQAEKAKSMLYQAYIQALSL